MRYDISTFDQLQQFVTEIAKDLQPGQVVTLEGQLGAGKTTFTQYLVKALGSDSIVRSPTFTILHEYTWKDNHRIYHFDLYRLKSSEEVAALGIEEMIEENTHLMLIEWPQFAKPILPDNTIFLKFIKESDDSRFIDIEK